MKTLVIAWTTYRQMARRPLFWALVVVGWMLLSLSSILPYFTMGEDVKMVKDQGLSLMLLMGLIAALFSASVSIADEIEGRTAVTLLSKPITRRQFIIGKFVGVMMGVGLLFLMLFVVFAITLAYRIGYEAADQFQEIPTWNQRLESMLPMVLGAVMAYFQVSILCSLCVAFSTRMPVHLNLSTCIVIFLAGNLAPQLVDASGSSDYPLVRFMAQFLAVVLPRFGFFNLGTAISTDATVPFFGYVVPCLVYCVFFTGVALCLALLMFEDRDLA